MKLDSWVNPITDTQTTLDYFGPARLLAGAPAAMRVALPDGRQVTVELALAYGYTPAEGDVLVVIGRQTRWYVIGVLETAGEMTLQFNGDVSVQAEGQLDLIGDKGVEIRGRTIAWRAEQVKVVADSLLEKAGTMLQKVRGLASLRSQEKHEIVAGLHATRAGRAQWTAEDTVTVNGQEIHLG